MSACYFVIYIATWWSGRKGTGGITSGLKR